MNENVQKVGGIHQKGTHTHTQERSWNSKLSSNFKMDSTEPEKYEFSLGSFFENDIVGTKNLSALWWVALRSSGMLLPDPLSCQTHLVNWWESGKHLSDIFYSLAHNFAEAAQRFTRSHMKTQ